MTLQELYKTWCKETKRSGGVLVGSSVQEFFRWVEESQMKVTTNTVYDKDFDYMQIQEAMVRAMLWGVETAKELPDIRPDQLHEMFIVNNHDIEILEIITKGK